MKTFFSILICGVYLFALCALGYYFLGWLAVPIAFALLCAYCAGRNSQQAARDTQIAADTITSIPGGTGGKQHHMHVYPEQLQLKPAPLPGFENLQPHEIDPNV